MYYPVEEWINDPARFVFLGSAKNPNTGFAYDFWLANGESVTARHGMDLCEYGSFNLRYVSWPINWFGAESTKDFLWGMHQAHLVCLHYLATGEKPLYQEEDPNQTR